MIKKSAIRICAETKKKFQAIHTEAKRNPNVKAVDLYAWLKPKRSIAVNNVIASPLQQAYRNKNEFTFGYRIKTSNELGRDANEEGTEIPSTGFLAAGSVWQCQSTASLYKCSVGSMCRRRLGGGISSASPIPPYKFE
jgi:hypothetical protein